jgi:diketogulonate reductase-like aldo/keto reductase
MSEDKHNDIGGKKIKDISTSKIALLNGEKIPILGLGTYLATGSKVIEAIEHALEVGYRHIDTAAFYGNEKEVGKAINTSTIPREEIFVTTKLRNSDHGYEQAFKAFQESYDKLGLEYIDLYLIHWPVQGLRLDSWKALEKIQQEGLCKSIGVSNYMIDHLKELLAEAEIMTMVNQV